MSDDTVNSQEELVEVSDEEADKLFENGGILDEQKSEPEPDPESEESKPEESLKEETEEKPEKEEKKVNYGALHEERMKRKELEGKIAVMEDRFRQIMNQISPRQEPQLPSVEEDPVTNLNTRLEQAENFQRQLQEQQHTIAQQNQVINAYHQKAAEYVQENPDFQNAYQYVLKGRLSELEELGVSREAAMQLAQQEEFGIALKSLQDGANPAERIYKIAQLRGYRKAEQKSEAPKKDLSVIEKGQKNAKVSGSAAPEGELTLEAIAEMDDDEFAKAWEKIAKQAS